MSLRLLHRALAACSMASILAGCAMSGQSTLPSTHAAAQRERGIINTNDLPAGHVITDGATPLYLRVSQAPVQALLPATEADADVTITFVAREADKTMVEFKATSRIKLDVYISPDGERWEYTSSCPLTTFEMWAHPIPYLAVVNPRQVKGEHVVCE